MCEKIFGFLKSYWRWLVALLIICVASCFIGFCLCRYLSADLASTVHQVNVFIDKSKSRLIKP